MSFEYFCSNFLYTDPKIDCVYICTPTDKHLDIVEKSLANKKTVMCEKPISLNNKDIIKCYQLAKENNVGLFCAFNWFVWQQFIYFLDMLNRALIHSAKRFSTGGYGQRSPLLSQRGKVLYALAFAGNGFVAVKMYSLTPAGFK